MARVARDDLLLGAAHRVEHRDAAGVVEVDADRQVDLARPRILLEILVQAQDRVAAERLDVLEHARLRGQAASAASMSPLQRSGESFGAKRLMTLPSLPTRNLVKFHLIERVPRMPGASAVSHFQSGARRVAVDVDLGHHREGDAVVQLAERRDLVVRPGSCAPNWLLGKPTTTRPRSR